MKNINTKQYWDNRFRTGDWEKKGGELQTKKFAESQIKYFGINSDFKGTILDFGCGLGDAMPIYKKMYPNANLIGIDISEQAINKCKIKYGNIALFNIGDHNNIPKVDIIIASNVFEHLTDDISIAKSLFDKCCQLFIIVPFNEKINIDSEHINSYDETSFEKIGNYNFVIFKSKGWSQYGFNLIFNIYFKNVLRFLLRKKINKRAKQIIYIFNK